MDRNTVDKQLIICAGILSLIWILGFASLVDDYIAGGLLHISLRTKYIASLAFLFIFLVGIPELIRKIRADNTSRKI